MTNSKRIKELGRELGEELASNENAEPMAVLVIGEMPTDCSECGVGDSNGYCYYAGDDVDGVTDNYCEGIRPDWCPLRPLPERKEEMDYLAAGYNKCLDDILEDE